MAASYQGIWLVNLYAPSGTANRQEREDFYNMELVYLLRSLPPTMIVEGDFNCVLSQADCTGNMNYSEVLNKLVRGLELTDVWAPAQPRAIYTHYTPHGAARLDCLYVSPDLRNRKIGVETVMAAFTDHLAVCLRITLDATLLQRGRGRWKMNAKLLEKAPFRDQLQQEWAKWEHQRKKYPNSDVVGKLCQKENPIHIHDGKEREGTER